MWQQVICPLKHYLFVCPVLIRQKLGVAGQHESKCTWIKPLLPMVLSERFPGRKIFTASTRCIQSECITCFLQTWQSGWALLILAVPSTDKRSLFSRGLQGGCWWSLGKQCQVRISSRWGLSSPMWRTVQLRILAKHHATCSADTQSQWNWYISAECFGFSSWIRSGKNKFYWKYSAWFRTHLFLRTCHCSQHK